MEEDGLLVFNPMLNSETLLVSFTVFIHIFSCCLGEEEMHVCLCGVCVCARARTNLQLEKQCHV